MAEEPNNEEHPNNFNYRQTDWRRYVDYRLDDLKGDMTQVLGKMNGVMAAGIVTPAVLDQKLKDQKESCVTQFKKPDNPDEVKNSWSLAKWGIKECGIFGAQAVIIFGLLVLLMKARGIIP